MTESSRKALVFGYSEVGYACLELLIRRGVNVVGVFTHEDDPGERQWFRSVSQLAQQHGIRCFHFASLNDLAVERLVREELRPDLIFSFYYRHMIPMKLLETARLGAFNMHGSFLPRYRGKAPVNWAILNGEDHTGATLHHMIAKPDAGDIVDQERVPIGKRDTVAEVMARVVEAAQRVLDRQLSALLLGTAPRHSQDAVQATYFGGRKPEDGRIDWSWPSLKIFNLVRAVTRPFPGAFADLSDGRRLVVWWAELESRQGKPGEVLQQQPLIIATGDGALRITDLEWRSAPTADNASCNTTRRIG
jgi:methionyl-tRNA formyltransferase